MIKLHRILLPTDFSEPASRAVPYACELANQFGAELHVLYVIHDLTSEVPDFGMGLAFPGYLEHLPERTQKLEEEAVAQLAKVLPDGWSKSRVILATRQGPPFQRIVEYAREHQTDLIVMGTHGRGMLSHTLLGSVAERVVRKAPCPVLTVRPDEQEFVRP
ncbi:MAG: universal stress protein [Planctomycetota bacterium]|jgi:nucleotide-binding universal stress UspA family protein